MLHNDAYLLQCNMHLLLNKGKLLITKLHIGFTEMQSQMMEVFELRVLLWFSESKEDELILNQTYKQIIKTSVSKKLLWALFEV